MPHFASMLDIKMNKISVSLFHQSSDWRIELLLDPALGCLRAGGYLESLILIILNIQSQDVVMSMGVKAFTKIIMIYHGLGVNS